MMALVQSARLAARAYGALRVGKRARIPGLELDRFGRRVGLELMARRDPLGFSYLVHPVDIVRYFEFDVARGAVPPAGREFLDVSSPRLFSLFVARRDPRTRVTIANPDPVDAAETLRVAERLRLGNVTVRNLGVEALGEGPPIDCAWSLSVVEHIDGDDGDAEAVRTLYARLRSGGALVLSVPSARAFRVEYRSDDVYGTQPERKDGRYFFQRVYDEASIRSRLVASAPWREASLRWFGERTPGWFGAYEKRWAAEGLPFVVDDPRFIATQFGEFATWHEMPGDGVCAIVLRK